MAAWPWSSVLVTGASSGLGRALAEACAAPGVKLHLSGRDPARLAEAAAACRARGAAVRDAVLDVTDAAAMAEWIGAAGRLDLVVANAGVSGGTAGGTEAPHQVQRIFATNVTGVLNTALPGDRRDGRAGARAGRGARARWRWSPRSPPSSRRRARRLLRVEIRGAALGGGAGRDGAPARHPAARGLPGLCPHADDGAQPVPHALPDGCRGRRAAQPAGIAAGRVRVAYPLPLYLMARLVGALPPGWRNALFTRLPAKQALE
jgi:hypothetical protein